MGCGDSAVGVPVNIVGAASSSPPPLPSTPSRETSRSFIAPPTAMATSNTMNILICCHRNQQAISEKLRQGLLNQHFSCHLLTNKSPNSLSARANIIRWCDVFINVISRDYQRDPFCMEAINYAKDVRKPMIVILADSSFRPYSALAAISASSLQSITLTDDGPSAPTITDVTNVVRTQVKKRGDTKNVTDPEQMSDKDVDITLLPGPHSATVLICVVDDGASVGQLVYDDLMAKNMNVALENLSKSNSSCSVAKCSVFVPILSPQFEQTPVCRAAFEEARRLQKPVVPVIAVNKWRPKDWLGLPIGGRTFFRIFDKESAYKPFYDSNRMTDLRVGIETACQPAPTEAEREQIEMKALRAQIEECKNKLQTWPPARKPRVTDSMAVRQPVRLQLQEPRATHKFSHIHYSVTRMDLKAPPVMIDEYGLPKRRPIDCMISYQWDNQELVRKVYEDLDMRSLSTWFDIWGSMQGSTNDSMATGVECAKVLLVFLSKAYIESANCQLEFRYAVQRGKAFVVLYTEPNIKMEQWMSDAIQGFPQYNVYRYNDLETLINGVPMIDVIAQAIRTVAQAQPSDIIDDCSAELFELRSLLDDARDAISDEAGKDRYQKCTRCGQQFDEHTKGGCKKHRAYYVGGSIIEGRWVCCQQQSNDLPGCTDCDHTSQPRKFVQDTYYGTWTWEPA